MISTRAPGQGSKYVSKVRIKVRIKKIVELAALSSRSDRAIATF